MQGTKPPNSYNVKDIQTIGFQPSNPILSLPWMLRHSIQPEAAQVLRDIPIEMSDSPHFGAYHNKALSSHPLIEIQKGLSDRVAREVFGHESIHALQELYEGNSRMTPTPSHAASIRTAYSGGLDEDALALESLPMLAQMYGFDISQMPPYLIRNMMEAGFIQPDYPMTNVHGSALITNRP